MSKYTIRKANATENKTEILPILRRNLRLISEERYAWNYQDCPYGKAHCWLVGQEPSNDVIASGALFPRRMLINGRLMHVAVAGDFVVDRDHRGYGPAIKLQKTIQSEMGENGLSLIYGIPNELSEALFRRIGYAELGVCDRYVKILRTEYKDRTYLPPSLLTRPLARVIERGMRMFSREKRYRRPATWSVEFPKCFDERFDVLWEHASGQFTAIGERSTMFLNWRYVQSPMQRYRICALIGKAKEILGYIVYYMADKMCHIVDFLCRDRTETSEPLLAEFIAHARTLEIGSVSIHYLGGPAFIKTLRNCGFFVYNKEPCKVLVYVGSEIEEAVALQSKEQWYFLAGDNDI